MSAIALFESRHEKMVLTDQNLLFISNFVFKTNIKFCDQDT